MVPHQPLTFTGDGRPRSEDALIAYTWDKYLRTRDEKWPAQLPMTKSAVRAMDAVSEFCRSAEAGGHTVDKFVVAGGSKRGWTAWTTAAVDERVVAISPLVIDVLNLEESFLHHWRAYGFWAPAVGDYEEMGVMTWVGTPQLRALAELVDPYEYRDRLTIPKFIINATGDEFFLPDSSQFYFDDLPGEKYLRYVPNASHSLENSDAIESALTFFQSIIAGTPRPEFSWELPAEGGIVLTTVDQPAQVLLWQATNPAARDFRVESIGSDAWTGTPLAGQGKGVYEAAVAAPERGWTAFFLEMTYPSGGVYPWKFTTPVRVVPDTLPFPAPLATILAASGSPLTAPGAIVSCFGTRLATTIEAATEVPLPTTLAETSVRIRDSDGVQALAPLFFVSPMQINYLIPEGTATGLAGVEVVLDEQTVTSGSVVVDEVSPGLFSANGDGQGIAAAVALTFKTDDSQSWEFIFGGAAPLGSRTGVPVALGADGDQVYLLLFGTGMRYASGEATATIAGEPVGVAGPAGQVEYVGLEQVNLGPLPRSLAGAGEVDIVLTVDGKTANVVTVMIQ